MATRICRWCSENGIPKVQPEGWGREHCYRCGRREVVDLPRTAEEAPSPKAWEGDTPPEDHSHFGAWTIRAPDGGSWSSDD